jgi:NitT/TauT family transport system permease protein
VSAPVVSPAAREEVSVPVAPPDERPGWPRRVARAIRHSDTLWFLATLLLAALAWEYFVKWRDIPRYLLPKPSEILDTAINQREVLLKNTWVTGKEVVYGFGAACLLGVPLAAAIVYSKILDRLISPLLVAIQTIPKVAMAPLFVVWLGHGLAPKIFVACTIAFFPIVIDTTVGLRSANPGSIELVRSMGANRWQTFRKVQFPGALPSIFGGLEVAITLAVVGAVVSEYIAANEGLGYLQLTASGILNTPLLFAAVIAMSILGLVLFRVVQVIERLVIPWHVKTHR